MIYNKINERHTVYSTLEKVVVHIRIKSIHTSREAGVRGKLTRRGEERERERERETDRSTPPHPPGAMEG